MARKKVFDRRIANMVGGTMSVEAAGREMIREIDGGEQAMVAAEAALNIRGVMLANFKKAGISQATFLMELLSVARSAAAEGEYTPALKGYELIGKQLGLFTETHQHLHVTGTAGEMREALDMQRMSDAELEAKAVQCRQNDDFLS